MKWIAVFFFWVLIFPSMGQAQLSCRNLFEKNTFNIYSLTQKGEGTIDGIPYFESKTYMMPAATAIKSWTAEKMLQDSKKIIDFVDDVLISYREGKRTLHESWKQLVSIDILKNTGYLYHPRFRTVFDPYHASTKESVQFWYEMIAGMAAVSPILSPRGEILKAGLVFMAVPRFIEGFNRWDPQFREFNEFFLLVWAEELYHVAQQLKINKGIGTQGIYYSKSTISQHFENLPKDIQSQIPNKQTDVFELDVYLKLLETAGPVVPDFYQIAPGYWSRSLINPKDVPLTQR